MKKKNTPNLDAHNIRCFNKDLSFIGRLPVSESTKQWIETRMYELRDGANRYERIMGEILLQNKIRFIHQAPFFFEPKSIYFCDFYIPDYRLIIEVDGKYHTGITQADKDRERDENFKSIGIKVVRVSNEEVFDKKRLLLRLSAFIK